MKKNKLFSLLSYLLRWPLSCFDWVMQPSPTLIPETTVNIPTDDELLTEGEGAIFSTTLGDGMCVSGYVSIPSRDDDGTMHCLLRPKGRFSIRVSYIQDRKTWISYFDCDPVEIVYSLTAKIATYGDVVLCVNGETWRRYDAYLKYQIENPKNLPLHIIVSDKKCGAFPKE